MSEKTIHVAVGILAEWRDGEWRILIGKRPARAVLGGLWELPGGKIEPGEDPAACVVREFQEELGLTVKVGRPVPPLSHVYKHGKVVLQPFFCSRIEGEPRCQQVTDFEWVKPEALHGYDFPMANAPLIEMLRTKLKGPVLPTFDTAPLE